MMPKPISTFSTQDKSTSQTTQETAPSHIQEPNREDSEVQRVVDELIKAALEEQATQKSKDKDCLWKLVEKAVQKMNRRVD